MGVLVFEKEIDSKVWYHTLKNILPELSLGSDDRLMFKDPIGRLLVVDTLAYDTNNGYDTAVSLTLISGKRFIVYTTFVSSGRSVCLFYTVKSKPAEIEVGTFKPLHMFFVTLEGTSLLLSTDKRVQHTVDLWNGVNLLKTGATLRHDGENAIATLSGKDLNIKCIDIEGPDIVAYLRDSDERVILTGSANFDKPKVLYQLCKEI